jgi:hypothetical protein
MWHQNPNNIIVKSSVTARPGALLARFSAKELTHLKNRKKMKKLVGQVEYRLVSLGQVGRL